MNAKFKEIIDEVRLNYEYNPSLPPLLLDIVEYIVYSGAKEPSPSFEDLIFEISRMDIGEVEISYIKSALTEIINTSANDESVEIAIQALGMLGDSHHVEMLRQKLELYLKKLIKASHPFAACIDALDNCGERLKEGSSFGPDELEKNIQLAREYLQKFNIKVPW